MKKLSLILIFVLLAAAAASANAPKSNWAKFDGGKVHYYDVGKRADRALILVHGWTCNADFWHDSYSAFPEYRVIAVDLPGHGRSDKPKTTYSMEYFARSIDAVMKAAKVRQAVIAGHSMGTPVARQFYRLYPQKTLGIIVVDGLLRSIGTPEQMKEFMSPLVENFSENAPKFVVGMLQPVADPNLKKMIRDNMLSAREHVAVSAMREMNDPAIWTNDKVERPVLAVMAQSEWWPAGTRELFAEVAPNLEWHMWADVSHFLQMERPGEFNSLVRAFIKKNKLL
jgi:pimeloyl-ACP methyl ester carboxylesterase